MMLRDRNRPKCVGRMTAVASTILAQFTSVSRTLPDSW